MTTSPPDYNGPQDGQIPRPPPDVDAWGGHTEMPVGEILRRTRLYYGQGLEDVGAILRIRSTQLEALELGRIDLLPGRVYAIGFVRAYAEYLGLDGDKIVHLFKVQSVGNRLRPELSMPIPASEGKVPNFYVLGGSFAALVLVILLMVMMAKGKDEISHIDANAIPAVSDTIQADLEPMGPPPPGSPLLTAGAVAGTAAVVAAPVHKLVINVKDSAWIEIRNAQGNALLSRILKAGDAYIVPDEPGLVMDTGNIGGLEFVLQGVVLPRLGRQGDVKRRINLDPDALKALNKAEPVNTTATAPAAVQ